MNHKNTILVAIFALFIANCILADTDITNYERKVDLKVVSPQVLQNVFVKYQNQIPNFLSPFGIVPWGKMLKGQLEIADPPHACQKLKYDPNQNASQRPFLLIEIDKNNNCSLENKIYHAQNHGAQLVILILKDKDTQINLEKDQQKLQLISIPVIQVNNEIGQSLTQFTKDTAVENRPVLIATFPTQSQTSNYLKLYIDINSHETYTLLHNLDFYNSIHKNKYQLSINFFIPESIKNDIEEDDTSEEAKQARQHKQEQLEKFCYGNGQYCDKDNPESIKEIIRQTCIFNNSTQGYFKYAYSIQQSYARYLLKQLSDLNDNGDPTHFEFEFYSLKAMREADIDPNVLNSCLNNSFVEAFDEHKNPLPRFKQDNYILAYHHNEFESLKVQNQLPMVFLNNKEIHSQTRNYLIDVMKTLCEADNDTESDYCRNLFKVKKTTNKGLNTGQIILIIMGSLAGSVILCYIFARLYSRYQKRRYSAELERVDSLVQSYIELNSDREKQQTNT